ncbi:ibr finger domain protein [Moniliophthora roreri MCA 2997]|uniref:Ibr finger domain protein n=1 Tax=Moniliophthora roreri (strain MCA 2997) TaxID=1381753 RepID=V2WPD1_MONRO|nr:ibr finger domain protein [Moniliophthora roreri MCA 2997]
MALPPALVELDPETSLLIAQQLTDIRQQISRATDEDEQYALQVMADDLGTYLHNYENFQERTSVVEEPVEATQGSDASSSIEKVECIACTENVPQAITLPTPCGHYYCQSCFETLLRTALTNETFFPPWCCNRSRRIDIQRIMSIPSSGEGTLIISDDLRFQLRAKSREYAVTPSERTYCPNPQCSIFLGSITRLRSRIPSHQPAYHARLQSALNVKEGRIRENSAKSTIMMES